MKILNKTKSLSVISLVVISMVFMLANTNTTVAFTNYDTCPDMNHDNHVKLVDLAMYAIALNNGDLAGDFSHDGEVDIVDTAIMTHYYNQKLNCKNFVNIDNFSCVDVNLDGNVDLIDLSLFAQGLSSPSYDDTYDFNGDGQINMIDMAILEIDYYSIGYICGV